jgi:hypothetical protein
VAAYLANTDNELAEDGVIAPKFVGAILMFFSPEWQVHLLFITDL